MNAQRKEFTQNTIRCEHCGNKTFMKIIAKGKYTEYDDSPDEDGIHYSWTDYHIENLFCPNCNKLNVIGFNVSEDIDSINMPNYQPISSSEIYYLYPLLKDFGNNSPNIQDIRNTYREANTCFQIELYTSSVIMCRKTVEMLCLYFDINQPSTLDRKLAKMRDEKIIDNKFYEWANALKSFGNEAVHTSEKFSKEDAQDILDFTYALVEYCIDFNYKFKQLLKRRGKGELSPISEVTTLPEKTINTLIESLNAEQNSIRYYAAIVLIQKEIEIEKAILVLINLTEKGRFISNATNCLKNLGLKAIPKLINALKTHSSSNVRSAAATLLGDISVSNPDVISAIVDALKDTNEEVQYKAAIALEKLGFPAINTFAKMYHVQVNSES